MSSAISGVPILEGIALGGQTSEWFAESRRRGWEDFQSLPLPTIKDETWRFSDLKFLDVSGVVNPGEVSDAASLVAQSVGLGESSARFVFGNNRLLSATAPAADLVSAGLVVMSLEEAVLKHPEIIREHYMANEARLGSRKFAALHQAASAAGVFVYVPAEMIVAQPIEIFHWVEGANVAVFPHTLVVCERNARATVVDCFRSADDEAAFACGVNDLVVKDGAKLDYLAVQQWSLESRAIHLNSTTVGRDASCLGMVVNLGGRFIRNESSSSMVAAGARSDMLSVSIAAGNQLIDQRTFQDHQQPNATSDLLYQNALTDKSRTIFSGMIKVEPGAHKTDAYQKVRNILLTDEAEANSMPGLKIEADDVRCTHGATTSQVDEAETFYLRARGIRPEDAKRLLVMGFFNTVLERLPNEQLRDHVEKLVERRLIQALKD